MARRPSSAQRRLDQDLVLARWALRPFGVAAIVDLGARLRDAPANAREADGATGFLHGLLAGTLDEDRLTAAALRRHDLAVAGHWAAITARRGSPAMKYFQYLAMLFTERYLEDWFTQPAALLAALNAELAALQADGGGAGFAPYAAADLNKLAFWAATGSGKTLLLHAAIRQYSSHHRSTHGRGPDRIILLTPNEALTRQHLEELRLSGLTGATFDGGTPLARGGVDVLDIHKLHETASEGRFAVDAFEGANLVLVDEGHRGAASELGAWMRRRSALAKGGFSFEYSATFGQSAGRGPMREAYAKAILVDYSYWHFYADGYGKDWRVLNLAAEGYDRDGELYFTACLLNFYQQLWLWERSRAAIAEFGIERPLWVFVGNTVADKDSDVLAVLRQLASFLNGRVRAEGWIGRLLAGEMLLSDAEGQDLFAGRFTPMLGRSGAEVYDDILRRLFNADGVQRLAVVNLQSAKGELALHVGNAPAFGVVNVGDDAGLVRAAKAEASFDTRADAFAPALFDGINAPDSRVNLLIGSRKFTEGWSSWRVSTMGLLNMGRGEGSQIIQLFGRGVRLRGRGLSLKRTASAAERPKGAWLELLERLTIFGVRADYMARFQDMLGAEGVAPPGSVMELLFQTRSALPDVPLKTLRLRPSHAGDAGSGFLHVERLTAFKLPAALAGRIKLPHVTLDLYPRISALDPGGTATGGTGRESHTLDKGAMALFDWDAVALALRAHKAQVGMTNLHIECGGLRAFCEVSSDWYTLYCPASEVAITCWSDVERQQSTLVALLIAYADAFHTRFRDAYERAHYDIADLTEADDAWVQEYQISFNDDDAGETYRGRFVELQELAETGKLDGIVGWSAANVNVVAVFAHHVYQPLLGIAPGKDLPLAIRPLAFDTPGEVAFVRALAAYAASPLGREALAGRKLYLLRNPSNRAKGLGFVRAGGFYPDFLLWLVDEASGRQWLSFVDPKGLRELRLDDPKLGLPEVVSAISADLGTGAPALSAFVLCHTQPSKLIGGSQAEYEARGALFTTDPDYLATMFARIGRAA